MPKHLANCVGKPHLENCTAAFIDNFAVAAFTQPSIFQIVVRHCFLQRFTLRWDGVSCAAISSTAIGCSKLLLLQFILMPILYLVQELTVRLGIFTGKGHGELIQDTFGKGWQGLGLPFRWRPFRGHNGRASDRILWGGRGQSDLWRASGPGCCSVQLGRNRQVGKDTIGLGVL